MKHNLEERDIDKLQERVHQEYCELFGRTPLQERLQDIRKQAERLHRAPDIDDMRQKASNLLGSFLQLCNEAHWDPVDLIDENLALLSKRALQYKTLGRRKKVAILGGAFDPITNGHIAVAKFVLDCSGKFDEVWLMPCYKHMYGKQMVAAEHRVEMCRLAAKHDGRISVSTFEIDHKLTGETYHVMKTLLEYKFLDQEYDFSLIIGQDNANTFDKWVNYELLEKMLCFVVVPRKGEERDSNVDWYLKSPHIYMSPDNDIPEISSSMIRNWVQDRQKGGSLGAAAEVCLNQYLHPGVLTYLTEHGFYQRVPLKT